LATEKESYVKAVTNHDLAVLVEQAGFDRSHAVLARQINHAAKTEYGLVTAYDGASVYWWLRGRSPEQPAPELLARILGGAVGREIGIEELGFPYVAGSPDHQTLCYPATLEDSIAAATRLWTRLGRGAELPAAPFATVAAVEAGWRWHFDPPDQSTAHCGRIKVSAADIEALRCCQAQFVELDKRLGGGHSRGLLADFLARDLAPLLAGEYPDPVGRELFQVAAELTCASAFMFYDVADHGRAQRAFVQSLRMAKAAGDRVLGAHVLANLATQAICLDRPAEAVRLAHAAIEGAGRTPPAMVTARLYCTAATAHAQAADAHAFHAAWATAENALARDDETIPGWAGYFTAAHLAGSAMRSLLDLGRPREALAHQEAAMCLPAGNVRTRALHTALAAAVYARAGQLDQACHLGTQAVSQATKVRSHRVGARVRQLAVLLRPHAALPEAAAFLDAVDAQQPQLGIAPA
jgi:tetratricopeptide (TPR) repeat protein